MFVLIEVDAVTNKTGMVVTAPDLASMANAIEDKVVDDVKRRRDDAIRDAKTECSDLIAMLSGTKSGIAKPPRPVDDDGDSDDTVVWTPQ